MIAGKKKGSTWTDIIRVEVWFVQAYE